jgi:hypothetical protein
MVRGHASDPILRKRRLPLPAMRACHRRYAGEARLTAALAVVRDELTRRIGTGAGSFHVPEFLLHEGDCTRLTDVGDAHAFFVSMIDEILENACGRASPQGGISPNDRVYLSFPRSFASLDRRTGTALTQIAFLRHITKWVSPSIFLTLPSGVIGTTNRKGSRGSPFAVTNPFAVDPSLGDPLLPGLNAEVQYRALLEACTVLGMTVGSILPLATLSIDSPLFHLFPGLGFWSRANPEELLFATFEDGAGHHEPSISTFNAQRFVEAPDPSTVRTVETTRGPHWVCDDGNGSTAAIANAFPDIVVGDPSAYTWRDVTALRYCRGDIPHSAGVRPEDAGLDRDAPAWTVAPAIAAWHYAVLGERLLWIDVGASVPDDVLPRTRRLAAAWCPKFSEQLRGLGSGSLEPSEATALLAQLRAIADCRSSDQVEDLSFIAEELWEFDVAESSADAFTGPLSVCVGAHGHTIDTCTQSLRYHLKKLARDPSRTHLAGVATHDTIPPPPRVAAVLWTVFAFLPNAARLIFSGSEWCAQMVTNGEFGSTVDGSRPAEGSLALFNDIIIEWDSAPLYRVPFENIDMIVNAVPDLRDWSYEFLEISDTCFGYRRESPAQDRELLVLANFGPTAVPLSAGSVPWIVAPCQPGSTLPDRMLEPVSSAIRLSPSTLGS